MDLSKIGVNRRSGISNKKITNAKMMDPKALSRIIDDAWLDLDVDEDELYNPLDIIPMAFDENPHIFLTWVMSHPYYLSMFCKQIMNVTIFPTQALILNEIWTHRFPILLGSRGLAKTYSIALYSLLRAIFIPGRKIVLTGAAFRQSKLVMDYCETIYRNAPLLRDLIGNGKRDDQVITHDSSEWVFKVGESRISAIPLGDGTTVRGKRSNDTVAEEFASINRHVFENVIGGFSVVNQNPVDKLRQTASDKKRKELGVAEEIREDSPIVPNQTLISGTCYYQFNHFYEYFKKHRDIIRSMGDKDRLRNVVGDEADNPAFDWKDYCIIRIPYNMMPDGYFDSSQISRSKVNTIASNFLAEYGACFPSDSDGFFKRSLIERCVPNESNIIRINNSIVDFIPKLEGNSQSRFVLAIDPASENDNCAITIIELREDHRRVVYCWTTNKKLHRKNLAVKRTQEDNYWAFVVRKIRDLMKRFPCCAIAIDSQGGGNAIMEGLHDQDKMEKDELPIWPILNQPKHEWCDTQEGLHIIHMLHFANNEWLGNAYFNTKKDMEEQLLLFPSFDGATIGLSIDLVDEKFIEGGLDENMENLIEEIEELKNELTCIIHTKTPSGKDQFTVPEIKTAEGKKARVKKDRASALIMANSVARSIMRDFVDSHYESNGGFATPSKNTGGSMYSNPWYSNAVSDAYDTYN